MKPKRDFKTLAINIALLIVGSILYAAGIALFLDPNQLAPGGVVGIAIIFNRIFTIPTGTIIFLINVPLMLLAWWKLGFKMIVSTMFVTVFSSALVDVMSVAGAISNDLLLSAVFGNSLVAAGMALIFKAGATSGGTDIIVKLIKIRYRHASTGTLFFITDAIVVISSMFVFKNFEVGLYAVLAMVVFTIVFDKLIYGADGAKMVHIISDKNDIIAKRIMALEIGLTYVKGYGGFTEENKDVILCAMKKPMLPKVQDIVKEEDPYAFIIVSSATEVLGEGHKSHYSERL
ncbi:MAG: YitT family protein [Clostridia bacterium]|nr:YitT family protein [Clostridia bacterium]